MAPPGSDSRTPYISGDPLMYSKRGSTSLRLLLGAILMSLLACDIPTGVPRWNTDWALPVEALELSVESLLPDRILVGPDESYFELLTRGRSLGKDLGNLCTPCQALDGSLAPKPAFLGVVESSVPLPADFVSAPAIGGGLEIELSHGFSFDPLRPDEWARGSIEIILLAAGDTLTSKVIDGELEALPPGTLRRARLPLRSVTLRGPLIVRVEVDSPEGAPTLIESGDEFRIEILESPIRVSEVEFQMDELEVDFEDLSFEFVGGEALINRIRGGSLILDIDNPFPITGSIDLLLSSHDSSTSLSREIGISPGHATREVEYSGPELRSVFVADEETRLSARGTMRMATDSTVLVRPGQVLHARSRLNLIIANLED